MIKKNKSHKNNNDNLSCNGNYIAFGYYGLKSLEKGNIKIQQIESGRKVISKYIKKLDKIWIRVYPDNPSYKKSIGLRMGGGKCDIDNYIFRIKPGKILYEIGDNIDIKLAKKILLLASFKIPVKTIFIF